MHNRHSAMQSSLDSILITKGISKIAHSGRTLSDHLEGTAMLLISWQSEAQIVTAGRYHSIYGTKAFNRSLLTSTDRSMVSQHIGSYAESLIWSFSLLSRPSVFKCGARYLGCMDYRLEKPNWNIDERFLRDLLEIELANLCEIGHSSKASDLVRYVTQFRPTLVRSTIIRALLEK